MCGIVGIISKQQYGFYKAQADLFTNMLAMDTIRGEDSTGVFGVDKAGKFAYMKGDTDGWTFTQSANYEKFENAIIRDFRIVIGHNRKATKGTINPHNAHPFVKDNIILVHNGTLWNQKDLNKEVEVDSEAIAHALAEHDAPKALNKLHGAYALVWYDEKAKTLSLARNSQRPLYVLDFDNTIVISSEAGLPLWLMGRDNHKPQSMTLLPTETIMNFPLHALNQPPQTVKFEEYKYVIQNNYETYNRRQHWQRQQQPMLMLPQGDFRHRNQMKTVNERLSATGIKAGDVIKFRMDSYDDNGDRLGRCLLGHPIFNNELDLNIFVEAVIPHTHKIIDYVSQGEIFTATVRNIRPMGGKIVVFADQPVVCKAVRDIHGDEFSMEEARAAIEGGCPRCKKEMSINDIETSILQRKGDGTYRILCTTCVRAAVNTAKQKKASLMVVPNSVQ